MPIGSVLKTVAYDLNRNGGWNPSTSAKLFYGAMVARMNLAH